MRLRCTVTAMVTIALAAGCLRLAEDVEDRPCVDDSDCLDGLVCKAVEEGWESLHRCREADFCISDATCGVWRSCQDNWCVPAVCSEVTAAACTPYPCQLLSGGCVPACDESRYCAEGYGCKDGVCVSAECGGVVGDDLRCRGYACERYVCRTSCTGYEDCASEYACVDGACLGINGLTGYPCNVGSDCNTGNCVDNECAPAP